MTHAKGLAISLAVVTALGLGGCGNTAQKNNTPTVERGGDTEGNNDLSRYTNADWLFQNYLGEYGLPEELKSMMMPDLKKLANGFALQYAQGKDVQKNIAQINMAMKALRYSGELESFTQSMVKEYDDGLYDAPDANATDDGADADANTTLDISPETQKAIDEANKLEEEYRKEQKDLVTKYHLPYPLEGHRTKVIIYSSEMKAKWGVHRRRGARFRYTDSWKWYDADFFWTDGAKSLGHMGLIDANDHGIDTAIDDMPKVGVQKHYGLDRYFNDRHNTSWTILEGHRYTRWSKSNWRRRYALKWAYKQVGRMKYSLASTKSNQKVSYCSSFVWKAYKRYGVDLDKDGGWYVWPRDITGQRYVHKFASQNLR